jgi:hypothetical protein
MGVGTLVLVAGCLSFFLHSFTWTKLAAMLAAGVISFVVITAYLIIHWSWQHVTRPLAIEDQERQRRYQREDLELALRRQQILAAIGQPAEPEKNKLDAVAEALIDRYYAREPITRDACTQASICTQQEWSQINKAFQIIGFKDGYTFTLPSSKRLAKLIWGQRTQVWENGSLWARDKNNNLARVD